MVLVRPKLTLAPGPLTLISDSIDDMPKDFGKAFQKSSEKHVEKFNATVQKVPSNFPAHPFIWSRIKSKQDAARRWYRAAIAGRIPGVVIETEGGRYKRQHDIIDAGAIVDDDGTVTIEIPGGAFGDYVGGPKQVPSHAKTPWPRYDKEAETFEEDMTLIAANTWFAIGEGISK